MTDPVLTTTVCSPGPLRQLDNQFAAIDLLPEALLPAVITHSGGDLNIRCQALSAFRDDLLQGQKTRSPCPWLPELVQQRVLACIEESGVLRYCRQNEEVSDALILDLLAALEGRQQRLPVLVAQLFSKREQEELKKLRFSIEHENNKRKKSHLSAALTAQQRAEIAVEAELAAWLQLLTDQGEFSGLLPNVWAERLQVWCELESVFADLGLVSGLGFDLSKGFFQSHGWMNLVRLHEVLKHLPQLREVIQTLGRAKDADGTPIIEEIATRMSIAARHRREVVTPLVPMETKGITRSDSVSRMLPQEAALLGHSVLKKLWHARRAERGLLSYAVEGTEVLEEERVEEQEVLEARAGKQANKNKGPMIVCLDTSGSMKGTPENIAKALVLECLSVATKEKRACYVYLFGSKGEIEEVELTLNAAGLERMVTFLSMSFGGGTDAEGPLTRALDRTDQEAWQNADILLVSDGEFSVTSGLSRKINNRREQRAIAVHGVLIGHPDSAMAKICDPLHQFSQWLDLLPNSHS